MKLKLLNFTKNNLNRNINYNKPLKSSIKIPNNILIKKECTTGEKLVKITNLIIKRLHIIEENNKKLLMQLKNLTVNK